MRVGAGHLEPPDRAMGGIELCRLDWDSMFFGRRMGSMTQVPEVVGLLKPDALAARMRHTLAEAKRDGYEHVMLRVPASDLRAARAAENAGLRLVDVAVDLAIDLGGSTIPGAPNVRLVAPSDVATLQEIAGNAFDLSRFTVDPFFTKEQVSGLYRQWVSNLCDGLAQAVLVADVRDEVVGFTSCTVERDATGRIPLIATSEAHRRKGIGRALVSASLHWFSSAHVHLVRVKTQAANYPAIRLYTGLGFAIATTELTFTATLAADSEFLDTGV